MVRAAAAALARSKRPHTSAAEAVPGSAGDRLAEAVVGNRPQRVRVPPPRRSGRGRADRELTREVR